MSEGPHLKVTDLVYRYEPGAPAALAGMVAAKTATAQEKARLKKLAAAV